MAKKKDDNRAGVPHGAGVVIADGRKALILRNDGTPVAPRLTTLQALDNAETRETRDIGTDRPGRTQESATTRRSAMEQTDFHTQAEARFAGQVAEAVHALHAAGKLPSLVLVAAPRTLAVLRDELPKPVQNAILDEIAKDLTNHPLSEIEKLLAG
jgi:protein required for attachment to host cells